MFDNSPFSELPQASLSNRGMIHNHSYENEFNLHVNEISFSYERRAGRLTLRKRLKVMGHFRYIKIQLDSEA